MMLNTKRGILGNKYSRLPWATVIQRGITPKVPRQDKVNKGITISANLPAFPKNLA